MINYGKTSPLLYHQFRKQDGKGGSFELYRANQQGNRLID